MHKYVDIVINVLVDFFCMRPTQCLWSY
jgi:hypothetical protein